MAVEATSNRQHAVPQNVMDVEFKIVGDLTMRQFIYLMFTGAAAYASFAFLEGNIFRWPLVLLFGLFGIGLAFVPIEDRGLDEWVVYFFRAVYQPTQRLWKKEIRITPAFSYETMQIMKQELITLAPTSDRRRLEEFLDRNIEEVVDPLDAPIDAYVEKVHEAFKNMPQATSPQETAVETFVEPEIPLQANTSPQQPIEHIPETEETTPEESQPKEDPAQEIREDPENQRETQELQQIQHIEEIPQENIQNKPEPEPVHDKKPPKIIKRETTYEKPASLDLGSENTYSDPLTPDRHTGRRFTNLVPRSGQIILPGIRGEMVLDTETNEVLEHDKNLETKTRQLLQLMEQIKQDNEYEDISLETEAVKGESQKDTEKVEAQAEDMVEKLRLENEKLAKEIAQIKKTSQNAANNPSDMHYDELKELENKKAQAYAFYKQLEKQMQSLKQDIDQKQQEIKEMPMDAGVVQRISQNPENQIVFPDVSNPNIFYGVVFDEEDRLLPNAVIVIKNANGEPVRANKTNQMGQFTVTTPVVNGEYTIEIGNADKLSKKFDAFKIRASGSILPPLEFHALK